MTSYMARYTGSDAYADESSGGSGNVVLGLVGATVVVVGTGAMEVVVAGAMPVVVFGANVVVFGIAVVVLCVGIGDTVVDVLVTTGVVVAA